MNCLILESLAKMWESVGKCMKGFFFSGSNVAKLDEKGRFVLPQEMRYGLVEGGKCEFAIGLGVGGCLAIYKKSAIEKMVAKFQENQHIAKFQKFFTLFFSTLHETECDKVGRVTLPPVLRNSMGIKKEIVVAGVMDKIELWPKEVYDENLKNLLGEPEGFMKLGHIIEEGFSLLHDTQEKSAKDAVQDVMTDALSTK